VINREELLEIFRKHLSMPGLPALDRKGLKGIIKELESRMDLGEDPNELLLEHLQRITREMTKRKIQSN
jgi:hypothetical protein